MRAFCLLVMGCACAWAQATYNYDGEGRRTEGTQVVAGKVDSGSYHTESARSLNGRVTPLERTEEHVVRQDGPTRIVERIIRRYDPNGNPGRTEKVRIEERKNPDGSTTTDTLTWRADINGRLQVAERAHAEARPAGGAIRSDTVIERPTLNGAFETVERLSATQRKTANGETRETVTLRRDANGRFGETQRQVVERSESNGRTSENIAQYEVGPSGRMEFTAQTVSRTIKNADGSERSEIDLYRDVVPGRPIAGQPRLIEQQLVERRPGAGGVVVENVSVRRPAPDGAMPSGAYQRIAQRVCTGECK